MADRILEIDHSVNMVNDIKTAEEFYVGILGEILGGCLWGRQGTTTEGRIQSRITQERAREHIARSGQTGGGWGEGDGGGGAISVKVGEALIPLFLWGRHVAEPHPAQVKGTPRISFGATRDQIEKAVEVFRRHRIPFMDVRHTGNCPAERSLYFRDPSSNFLEFCCPRAEGQTAPIDRPQILHYVDPDGFFVDPPEVLPG